MPWFMIDIEADGPIPGDYSMIELGAVLIDPEGKLDVTFHGKLRPISDQCMKEALNVTSTSRADTFGYDHPKHVMEQFFDWIIENSHPSQRRNGAQSTYRPVIVSLFTGEGHPGCV